MPPGIVRRLRNLRRLRPSARGAEALQRARGVAPTLQAKASRRPWAQYEMVEYWEYWWVDICYICIIYIYMCVYVSIDMCDICMMYEYMYYIYICV